MKPKTKTTKKKGAGGREKDPDVEVGLAKGRSQLGRSRVRWETEGAADSRLTD